MIEKLTAMQDKYARDVGKVHSHVTAMQDRMAQRCFKKGQGRSRVGCQANRHGGYDVPGMLEKLAAMQDMLFQRWLRSPQPCRIGCPKRCLKSSQPCRISIPEMFEKFAAM